MVGTQERLQKAVSALGGIPATLPSETGAEPIE
jgi:hypothetical protein